MSVRMGYGGSLWELGSRRNGLDLLDLLPVPDPNFITSMKQNYQDLIDFFVAIP